MDRRRHRAAVAVSYAERHAQLRADEAALDARHERFATTRLALAAATAVLAWLAFGAGRMAPVWLCLPVVGLVAVAVAHARVLAERARAHRVIAWVDDGLARVEGRWQGRGMTGTQHLPPDHPYADDLD
ncbi:MAG TPA: hypothetical protein VMW48_09810, partial [Vicinamibacterales bacterium]|nr:hypothetical protein [Vicinamibacterales bacterium]